MDIIKYNKNFIGNPCGLVNLGATCYFNSLLQCLLSCSSIFEVLDTNRNLSHIKNSDIAIHMLNLYDAYISGKSIKNLGVPIWKMILKESSNRSDNVKFTSGQQDAHEGLMLLLDILDDIPEIKRLFEHRYHTKILCEFCEDWVVDVNEKNMTFDVQPDLKMLQIDKFQNIDENYNKSMDLNTFLKKQNSYVDGDFKCPRCDNNSPKLKITTLTMVPEILTVVIKKYEKKVYTPFPEKLEFLSSDRNKKLIYELVAQSEHSGSMSGGHYWAICKRKENFYTLNDTSVSKGKLGATPNSYIIFYHYKGIETIKI